MRTKQSIMTELRKKVDELILELSSMFKDMDSIEIIFSEKENNILLRNLTYLCKLEEVDKLSYEDIELGLKRNLVFKVKKEFAEKFLEKELGIILIKEEKALLGLFIRATTIYFQLDNDLNIKSENCKAYPKVVFIDNINSDLERVIIEESACKEIKGIKLRQFFGDREFSSEIEDILTPRLQNLLKNELTFIQKELNECFKNKMDWLFDLNKEYIRFLI